MPPKQGRGRTSKKRSLSNSSESNNNETSRQSKHVTAENILTSIPLPKVTKRPRLISPSYESTIRLTYKAFQAAPTTSTPPEPTISAAAARRAKKNAKTAPTTSTSPEPPISTVTTRHTKKLEETVATTSTSPEPPISAAAARRAKKNAKTEPTTSTPPEPPISTVTTRHTKKLAETVATTSTSPEPPISAAAARRARKMAEAAMNTSAKSPSNVVDSQQFSTSGDKQPTIHSTSSSRQLDTADDEEDNTILYTATEYSTNELSTEFYTAKESFTNEHSTTSYTAATHSDTPDEKSEADETTLDGEYQGFEESWVNAQKKKKGEAKRTSKLMDPYSVSTHYSKNVIPFQHGGETHYCIVFEKGQKLVFVGYSLIGALYGSIDIGGSTISSSQDIPTSLEKIILDPSQIVPFFPVFSPKSSALAVVQSIPYAETLTVSPSSTLVSMYLDLTPLLEPFKSRLHTLESIIIVKSMDCCGVETLEHVTGLKNLFSLDPKTQFEQDDENMYKEISGFQPVVRVTQEVRAMEIDATWSRSIDDVLEYEEDASAPSVSMVCGTKNAGKSSFARFMVNRLLNTHRRVAYLETDVGQTEFTPSGLVSLHIIQHPILGPPFTHINLKPKKCFFIGSTSPDKDTSYYQDCIKQLLRTYYNEFNINSSSDDDDISQSELVPLVVNTSGWIKGLGEDILLGITECVVPTHVFAFRSGGSSIDSSLNFNQLIVNAAQQSSYPEYHHVAISSLQVPEITTTHVQQQPIPLSSFQRHQKPSTMADKYHAADHRNMMLASYLYHDAQNFGRQDANGWWKIKPRLLERLPWTCNWENFDGVWVLFDDVPLDTLLVALNGSLVGLLGKAHNNIDKVATAGADGRVEGKFIETNETIDTTSLSTTMEDSHSRAMETIPFKYYSPTTSAPPNPISTICYGLGIIRTVDARNRKFHLLTPLPLCELRHVNCLVKGALEIPVHLFLDKFTGSRHTNSNVSWRNVPYLSHDVINSAGSTSLKPRRNLMRRSQDSA